MKRCCRQYIVCIRIYIYSLSRSINIDIPGMFSPHFSPRRRNKFIRVSLTWRGSLIPLWEIYIRGEMVSFWHPKWKRHVNIVSVTMSQSPKANLRRVSIHCASIFLFTLFAFLRRAIEIVFPNKSATKRNRDHFVLLLRKKLITLRLGRILRFHEVLNTIRFRTTCPHLNELIEKLNGLHLQWSFAVFMKQRCK